MQKNNYIIKAIEENNNKKLSLFIKSKIDNSNFQFINTKKYKNIRYEGCEKYEYDDMNDYYHRIDFLNYDNLNELLYTYLDKEFSNKFDNNYSDILESFLEYWTKIYNNIKVESLIGDLGEALFILKCIEINKKDKIQEALANRLENDTIDFNFQNASIEIKTTTFTKSEIDLVYSQIPNTKSNKYLVVIKFDIYKTKDENTYNIIDLYKKIKEYGININTQKEIFHNNEFSEKIYINLNECKYYFFNNDFIPKTEIKNNGSLKKITYTLDVTNSLEDNKNFDQKLNEIL